MLKGSQRVRSLILISLYRRGGTQQIRIDSQNMVHVVYRVWITIIFRRKPGSSDLHLNHLAGDRLKENL